MYLSFGWYFLVTLISLSSANEQLESQSAIFSISSCSVLPVISLMCLSVPFLIIPSAPTITDLVIDLRCHYYNFYFTHKRVFHTSVCWWFSSWVLVTASLLKSPGFFSTIRLFPSLPIPIPILWWLYRPITISSTVTCMFHNYYYHYYWINLHFRLGSKSSNYSLCLGSVVLDMFFRYMLNSLRKL